MSLLLSILIGTLLGITASVLIIKYTVPRRGFPTGSREQSQNTKDVFWQIREDVQSQVWAQIRDDVQSQVLVQLRYQAKSKDQFSKQDAGQVKESARRQASTQGSRINEEKIQLEDCEQDNK